jgi:hypothetical protein
MVVRVAAKATEATSAAAEATATLSRSVGGGCHDGGLGKSQSGPHQVRLAEFGLGRVVGVGSGLGWAGLVDLMVEMG